MVVGVPAAAASAFDTSTPLMMATLGGGAMAAAAVTAAVSRTTRKTSRRESRGCRPNADPNNGCRPNAGPRLQQSATKQWRVLSTKGMVVAMLLSWS